MTVRRGQPSPLGFAQFLELASGAASPQGVGRDDRPFHHQGTSRDQGPFSDDASTQNGRRNPDQGPVPDDRAVNNGFVTQRDSVADDAGVAFVNMQDRAVLDVRFLANLDPFLIAAQYAAVPNRTAGLQFDATQQDRPRRDPGRWIDQGAAVNRSPIPVLFRAVVAKSRGSAASSA